MSRITFRKNSSVSSTVSNLLDSVLPGHSTSNGSTESRIVPELSSASQIINASSSKRNLNPEEVRRLKKKQKLVQRQEVQKETAKNQQLKEKARYDVLMSHYKNNTLNALEKQELKKLIKRNVASIQSWRTDIEEDLDEIQKDILDLKHQGKHVKSKKKRQVNGKVSEKELYEKRKKSQEHRFPGLTPGLAPVGMDDSDSDEE